MSKSVEEVSKLTESTYKVGTGGKTTGAQMEQQLDQLGFLCDFNQLSKRQQVFPDHAEIASWKPLAN